MACTQCDYIIQQDDARVLSARHEIREAVDAVEKHQQQFNELGQDRLYPDPNIPITFTKVIYLINILYTSDYSTHFFFSGQSCPYWSKNGDARRYIGFG